MIRAGSAVTTTTRGGSPPPMSTVMLPLVAAGGATDGEAEGLGFGLGVGLGLPPGEGEEATTVDPPPEIAVTVAVPERLSETRFARAMPRVVGAWGSIEPSVVKNWTTVPSAAGVPFGLVTTAVMTETPPCAGMKRGLAKTAMVEPGGAVRIVEWHRRAARPRVPRTKVQPIATPADFTLIPLISIDGHRHRARDDRARACHHPGRDDDGFLRGIPRPARRKKVLDPAIPVGEERCSAAVQGLFNRVRL